MTPTNAFQALSGFLLAGLVVFSTACQQESGSGSETKSLSRLKDKTNIAVLLMGSMEGIPGVRQDPEHMKQALTSSDWGFQIRAKGTSETAAEIIKDAADAAVAVGYDGGTFFFYFSGHGAEDGSLIAADRGYMFSEVADAIRQARKDPVTGKTRAIARGIIFADACFSGNLVDGSGAVSANLTSQSTNSFALAPGSIGIANLPQMNVDDKKTSRVLEALEKMTGAIVAQKEGLFDEMIIIGSSNKMETSGDTNSGGVGTNAFIDALTAANDQTTFGQFFEAMSRNAYGQTPVYKTVPETLRQQPVKGADETGQAPLPARLPATTPVGNGAPADQTPAATPQTPPASQSQGGSIFDTFFQD